MTRAIYNEIDPKAAAWLRELQRRGLIASGTVDETSITDLHPEQLKGITRAHFFAGIGGWDYALRLAGWPDDRPVWTGSCPCQPFSSAGKGKGAADERHLWPAWFRLIRECRPAIIFGEQVASAIGHGWLDGVCADLESEGYAVGSAVLGAHSVGAPHIRQRLWWVADSGSSTSERRARGLPAPQTRIGGEDGSQHGDRAERLADGGKDGWLGYSDGERRERKHALLRQRGPQQDRPEVAGAGSGCWREYEMLEFADGKTRRIESGTTPLAHGIPARVVRLRGYGNAIVPQVAAAFIESVMDILNPHSARAAAKETPHAQA
jgi:DNA (cytosine-5)-methyltransferase 1